MSSHEIAMPCQPAISDNIIYASLEELSDSLNKATSDLAHGHTEEGFDRMMYVMKALTVFLHCGIGTKDAVCMDGNEVQVSPFPMKPLENAGNPVLGGPGPVFPCLFIVTTLPRENIRSVLSSLSAVAAYNMGIICHGESLACKDHDRHWQFQLQAKQFYGTAYNLLDRLRYIKPQGSLIFVHMALCTNMAEIEFADGNLDSCRQWKSVLRDTMACVPENKTSAVFNHFHNTCIFYTFETPAAHAA